MNFEKADLSNAVAEQRKNTNIRDEAVASGHLFKTPQFISKYEYNMLRNTRWMDDLRFYVLSNSISVISGRCYDDNEKLCAMEPRLRLERPSPRAGLESGTARSVA